MPGKVVGQLRVEGGRQILSLSGRYGASIGETSEHVDSCSNCLDDGRADEDGGHRIIGDRRYLERGLEGLKLRAKGITPKSEIHQRRAVHRPQLRRYLSRATLRLDHHAHPVPRLQRHVRLSLPHPLSRGPRYDGRRRGGLTKEGSIWRPVTVMWNDWLLTKRSSAKGLGSMNGENSGFVAPMMETHPDPLVDLLEVEVAFREDQ